MKKLIACILFALLLFYTACSNVDAPQIMQAPEATRAAEITPAPTATPAPTPEPTLEPTAAPPDYSDQWFSAQCGDNAIWEIEGSTKTLTISGRGTIWPKDTNNGERVLFDLKRELAQGYDIWIWDIVENVIIEEGITCISNGVFYDYHLSNLTLPKSLKRIEEGAFLCAEIDTFFIPANVSHIGEHALRDMKVRDFQVDSRNKHFTSENGVLYNKQMTRVISFVGNAGVSFLALPDSVQIIGDCAFSGCKELQSIALPKGLQRIEPGAFFESGILEIVIPEGIEILERSMFCDSALERIVLPGTIKELHEHALSCPNLKEIVFMGSPPAVNGYYVFMDCPKDMVIRYPAQYESEWTKNGAKTWQGFPIQSFDASRGVPDRL
ncbi:MAG: leucine-rich repeat domain-containing protein [Clostridiales bacterium]|nr:leucine-rich repeat domain-containing protein [Clostridiales bacterium]